MTRATIFWVLMLFVLVLGLYHHFWLSATPNYWGGGMTLIELVLFGLLGWQVFGPAIKG